ncbi:Fur family transcriptional regulator [Variovorax saccharolyticus]|uniref:Fur family transcriptional regulator n=1 Tax=Variovorax saccharolyticus TaxID=3053516 RepID=UPI0025774B51|nr:transcriptional repressor [Variovorax sp. J31P216]MDM0024551.1 transcriptional repressor [Variovorax sp. J31P216]
MSSAGTLPGGLVASMRSRLKAAGLRPSHRHARALEVVAAAAGPLTAAEVFERLYAEGVSATPTTVYRALHAMEAHGILRREFLTDDRRAVAAYRLLDPAEAAGHVLVCPNCHRSVRLPADVLQSPLKEAARLAGMAISDRRITVEVICDDCASPAGVFARYASSGSRPGALSISEGL